MRNEFICLLKTRTLDAHVVANSHKLSTSNMINVWIGDAEGYCMVVVNKILLLLQGFSYTAVGTSSLSSFSDQTDIYEICFLLFSCDIAWFEFGST